MPRASSRQNPAIRSGRNLRQTSKPFMPGSIRSSSRTSGRFSSAVLTPEGPSLAADSLQRGNLFGASGATAGRHVRFLIPREHRGGAVDPLDLE